jgi:hypothetical protein
LSVVLQNRQREVGVGHASRSSSLLGVEASLTRVSQSGLKTGGGAMVFAGLTSKLVATIFSSLASKLVATVSPVLASKLVATVSPVLASKPVVGFLV